MDNNPTGKTGRVSTKKKTDLRFGGRGNYLGVVLFK